MMRIGLLIDSLVGGGAERVVLNLAHVFSKLGHDVHIILLKNLIMHDYDKTVVKLEILSETGCLSKNKLINKIKLSRCLKEKIKQIESHDGIKFDLFISNAEDSDVIAKLAKLPHVFVRYRNSMKYFIDTKIGKKGPLKTWIRTKKFYLRFRLTYSNMNIITVSDAMQHDIVNEVGVKPKSIRTIYNPFDFEMLRKKAEEKIESMPSEPYIVYVAKFENRKRHDVLVRAFAKLNLDLKLVLVGGCHTQEDRQTLEKIKNLSTDLGVVDKVVYTGFQSNPYPWIKKCHFICYVVR